MSTEHRTAEQIYQDIKGLGVPGYEVGDDVMAHDEAMVAYYERLTALWAELRSNTMLNPGIPDWVFAAVTQGELRNAEAATRTRLMADARQSRLERAARIREQLAMKIE
jgi:hypothetical protein